MPTATGYAQRCQHLTGSKLKTPKSHRKTVQFRQKPYESGFSRTVGNAGYAGPVASPPPPVHSKIVSEYHAQHLGALQCQIH